MQDFLSVRDGETTESPELARLCGGDSVPDIISSGPNMLIEFKTSPFDSLFHPVPISYLLGFELQVHVSLLQVIENKKKINQKKFFSGNVC